MFNPMGPSELILALGRVLRAAADGSGPSDDYRRSQLLSAYSIARHLSAEEAARGELLDWFRAEVVAALPEGSGPRAQIAAAREGTEIGELLVQLLEKLGDSQEERAARKRLQLLFVEMADREVAALASAGQ